MPTLRERLRRANERKGIKGWWTGTAYRTLDAAVRCGVVDVWDDLPAHLKSELMALCRAQDTMRAWETHQATKG